MNRRPLDPSHLPGIAGCGSTGLTGHLTRLNICSAWLAVARSLSSLALGMALLAGPADVLRDQDRVNRAPQVSGAASASACCFAASRWVTTRQSVASPSSGACAAHEPQARQADAWA